MLSDFAEWIKSAFEFILGWLYEYLWSDILSALQSLLVDLFTFIFEITLTGLALFLEWIPVPSFMREAGTFWGQIPGTIVFFFQFFAIAEGMAMIGAALALRFILRRIPIIG